MGGIIDFVKDPIGSIGTLFLSAIAQLFANLTTGILKFFGGFLNQLIISPDQGLTTFWTTFEGLLISISGGIALAMLIARIIGIMGQRIYDDSATVSPLVARTIASAALIVLLPAAASFLNANIAANFLQLITSLGTADLSTALNQFAGNVITIKNNQIASTIINTIAGISPGTMISVATGGAIVIAAIALGLAALIVIFFFQACVRYGDLIYLQALAPVAAATYVNETTDYVSVWWREMMSVTFQLPLQVLCLYGGLSEFAEPSLVHVMVGIGLLILMVRTPAILRNFMYSTGTGRAAMSVIGGTTRWAARKYLWPLR